MGKLFKVLGWLVGMLLLLIIAAIILVPMFVDVNDHKERIILEVKKVTGRDLGIAGEIGLSVFPSFALELNGLSLSNAEGFADAQFAAVKHAQVRVDIFPLLFRQMLVADTVKIEGLTLNLAKSKQGSTNWEDMLGSGRAAGGPQPQTSGIPDERGMMPFSIGGVTIKDARVVWDDQSSGERYEVANLNFETGEIRPGRAVDISFNTALESRKPLLKGSVGLIGKLQVDDTRLVFTLDDLVLESKISGEGLPEQGVEGQLQANIRFDQTHGALEVDELVLALNGLVLKGELQGIDLLNQAKLEGSLRVEKVNPRELMGEFGLPVPETADPAVLNSLELSADFKAGIDHVAFDNLLVKLDQTVTKGKFEVTSFTQPTYLFDLQVGEINVDRYLPPPPAGAASGGHGAQGGAGGNDELFPVETLRQLRFDGRLLLDSLTINQIHAEAVLLKLRGRDGKLTADQEIGRFYDGLTKGSVSLNVSGDAPQLQIDQELTRILTGPLLMDLLGDDRLLGSGDLKLNLASRGGSLNQIKRTLNGSLSFDFRDGAVKGFNLAKMIRETRAKLSGESTAILNEPEQTDFSELTGSARIVNGLVENQQLFAKSPYLRVNGSGRANLVQESLDYTIRPVIVNTPQGQGGQGLEELVGIPIPVRIQGGWSNLQFSIQLAQILEEQQKARLQEKIDSKVEEKLQEKVPEELQDKLKGKLKKLF